MTAKKNDPPFEDLYKNLEETVEKLEKGGLSLEQSIALYEEGMQLAKQCQGILDGAEQRITKLRESFIEAPADEPAEDASPEAEEAPVLEDD